MSLRHAVRAVAASAAAVALAGSISVLGFSAPAWAAPSQGGQVPGSAQCDTAASGPCAPQAFSSGQQITVAVPANTVWPSGSSIKIIECAQAAVTAATDASALPLCDGLTINGTTIFAASDGSFTYNGYTIYSLPNTFSLGESPGAQPQCDNTHACVLYIGTDQTHPQSSPHVWSQTWWVTPNATDSGANPGDGTPEAPLAIGLPLLAVGLVGGTLFVRRRRSAGSKV